MSKKIELDFWLDSKHIYIDGTLKESVLKLFDILDRNDLTIDDAYKICSEIKITYRKTLEEIILDATK